VQSKAQSVEGEIIGDILTRYPSGGSTLRNMGVFVQHNWQNQDSSLIWVNGLRWSSQKVEMQYSRDDPFVWPDYFYEGISNADEAVVSITGLNYRRGPYIAKFATGTAFRSPNVDDLAKIRVNGNEITVPNPNLSSETVWNTELTIGYRSQNFTFGVTGFYTRLSDAVIRTDFALPDGSTTFVSGPDTLMVTANVNANSGTIKGLSFNGSVTQGAFTLSSSYNIQTGTSADGESVDSPLGHIPPTYSNNRLAFTKDKYSITLQHDYNGWKRVEDYGGSVDNLDQATVDGTPAWQTFDISGQYKMGSHWTLNVALRNLTDLHYRPFASGVSGAGRHVVLAVRYSY